MNNNYENRWYRNINTNDDLKYFNIRVEQSDLYIGAEEQNIKLVEEALIEIRNKIKEEISKRKEFLTSFEPLEYYGGSNDVVSMMYESSRICNVGPMAAVAGTTAQYIGEYIKTFSNQVIIENGGDIYIDTKVQRKIALYAGNSKLSNKLAIDINPGIWGVCTSAATIGHSYSSGKADAAVCIARSASLADAAATKLGNIVTNESDLADGVKTIVKIKGIIGAIAIVGDKIAISGDIKLSPISGGFNENKN